MKPSPSGLLPKGRARPGGSGLGHVMLLSSRVTLLGASMSDSCGVGPEDFVPCGRVLKEKEGDASGKKNHPQLGFSKSRPQDRSVNGFSIDP